MSKSINDMVRALQDISSACDDMDMNPTNDFGQTVGDELHYIEHQLSRIADSLETLVAHFTRQ